MFILSLSKKRCVLGNGSENLGREGTHFFLIVFWKKYNFVHLKSINSLIHEHMRQVIRVLDERAQLKIQFLISQQKHHVVPNQKNCLNETV